MLLNVTFSLKVDLFFLMENHLMYLVLGRRGDSLPHLGMTSGTNHGTMS